MNNKKAVNNNSNHGSSRKNISPIAQNSKVNNRVNRANSNSSLIGSNPAPQSKNREVALAKRKAPDTIDNRESIKTPRTNTQPLNGLQGSNFTQATSNFGSASIDQYSHYPMNYDQTNAYNDSIGFDSYKPSFSNNQYYVSNCNNNANNFSLNRPSTVAFVNTQQVTSHQSKEDLNKQWELQRKSIENCLDLSNKYFDEGQYEHCWQEAEQGLKMLGCSNEEKIDFYINISLACNKLKEYARVQQVVYAAIGIPECSNVQKIGLYNTLSLAYNGLKHYVGAQQAIKAALNLPECSNLQKIAFYANLSFGYNEQKQFAEAKQAAEIALELPECPNVRKIVLYNNLSMGCIGLKDYAGAQAAIEAALDLPECSNEQKIKLFLNLVKVFVELKNYAGAKKSINAVLELPNCNRAQNIYFYSNLSLACCKLEDYVGALEAALMGIAFSGCEGRRKALFLGIILKYDNKENPEERLKLILCILDAVKGVANDIDKKEAINFLEEVVSVKEIITMLFTTAESKLDIESQKSIWKTIEAFAQLKQL